MRGREHDQFTFWPTPDAPLGGHAAPKPPDTSSTPSFDTVAAELLAFADAVIYASARKHKVELVTSDDHFEGLPDVTYFQKQAT